MRGLSPQGFLISGEKKSENLVGGGAARPPRLHARWRVSWLLHFYSLRWPAPPALQTADGGCGVGRGDVQEDGDWALVLGGGGGVDSRVGRAWAPP